MYKFYFIYYKILQTSYTHILPTKAAAATAARARAGAAATTVAAFGSNSGGSVHGCDDII